MDAINRPCVRFRLYERFDSRKMKRFYDVGINAYGSDIPKKLQKIYNADVQLIEKSTEES